MNIFGRGNSQASYNSYSGNTGYTGSTGYSGNSYSGNSAYSTGGGYGYRSDTARTPQLGSYRVTDYDSEKLSPSLASVAIFKQNTPQSIALREQTIHLSSRELRAQDYYLIRNGQLTDKHNRNLNSAKDKRCFNAELLRNTGQLAQLLSFKEDAIGVDNVVRLCNGSMSRGTTGGYPAQSNNNMFTSTTGNSSNNMFSSTNNGYNTRGNTSSPFSSNTNNNPFTSTGRSNSIGNNTGNNTGNSMFNSRTGNNPFSSNSGNNMFSNNTGNNGSNNMFSSGNYNNNNNNNGGNSLFGNRSNGNGNGNGNNLFNNGGNNNPFSNNNNGNNLFSNSNGGNNNNPFSNNNNSNMFSNGNRGNNLFSNGSNGNNLFNNGGNNNLFNNGNNNNNGYNGGGNFMSEYSMLQMMHLVQQCVDKVYSSNNNVGTNNNVSTRGSASTPLYEPTSYAPLAETGLGNYGKDLEVRYADWFDEPYSEPRRKKKRPDNTAYVILKDDSSSRSQSGSFIRPNQSQPDAISSSQYNRFYAQHEPSMRGSSIRPTQSFNVANSRRVDAIPEEDYMQASNLRSRMVGQSGSQYRYRYVVTCIWSESLNTSKVINQEQREIEDQLVVGHGLGLIQLTQAILEDIFYKHEGNEDSKFKLRRDAELTLQMPNPSSKFEYLVKGTLVQNKINLPRGYTYLFNSMDGWKVRKLVIDNKFGRIEWPGEIDIEGVNFETDLEIVENEADIRNKLDTEIKNITIFTLPPKVAMELPDERRARAQMIKEIQRAEKRTGEKITLLDLDLANQSYTLKIQKQLGGNGHQF